MLVSHFCISIHIHFSVLRNVQNEGPIKSNQRVEMSLDCSQDLYFSNKYLPCSVCLRPNKKTSVFWVTGLKILGRVGTNIFFLKYFFAGKNIILCILKGILLSKSIKLFFSRKPEQKF